MKQIVCEMCESTQFLKEDGMFICQGCGMKYSLEEAKKMMVEVDGQPNTATGGSTDKLANMLTLAQNALDQSNNAQAEEYANKVLELDSSCAQAWLIKGQAVGWQSTLVNIRFSEMASCFKFALDNASDDERANYKAEMSAQAGNLCRAVVNLACNNFAKYPSKENAADVRGAVADMLSLQLEMLKLGVTMEMNKVYDDCSLKINDSAVAAANMANSDFGPQNSDKTRYAWNQYMDRNDNCLEILKHALDLCYNEKRVDTINNNYKTIMNNVIGSCSYKFEATGYWSGYVQDYSLTDSAKSIRRNMISEFNTKANKRKKTLQEEKQKKEREAREAREKAQKAKNDAYWAKHASEKAALEEEKETLKKQVLDLETQVKELDKKNKPKVDRLNKEKGEKLESEKTVLQQQKLIGELELRYSQLGFFKGKEKKAITARLDDVERPKLNELKKTADDERKAYNKKIERAVFELGAEIRELRKQIEPLNARIKEIDNELTKPR